MHSQPHISHNICLTVNRFSKGFSVKSRECVSRILDTRLAHRKLLQFNCTVQKICVKNIRNVPFALQLLGPVVPLGLLPKAF